MKPPKTPPYLRAYRTHPEADPSTGPATTHPPLSKGRIVVLTQETTSASTAPEAGAERLERVSAAAYRIRHHALTMGEVQGQGYVGQALGAADMLAVVYADQLRFRADDPEWEARDRFLLSTG